MKAIPDTENPIVLRSDFTDDQAWTRLCTLIASPIGPHDVLAHVDFVDDPSFVVVTPEALRASIPGHHRPNFIVIADRSTFAEPEQPLLVMDLLNEPGRTFRALPTRIGAIENNLSLGNMGFEDFADAVEEDGIFRGFPGERDEDYNVTTTPRAPLRRKPSPPQTFLGRALLYTYKLLRGKPGA